MQHIIDVVNKHHHQSLDGVTIYVGRGSPLGNPFYMNNQHMRDEVCDKYILYIKDQINCNNRTIIDELVRIHQIAETQPVHLQCFCAPRRCHADTIKKILETGDI